MQSIHDILKGVFGFKTFRKGQEEALCTLMQEGRLLCIQPTGHGKSLLYQLPSCLLDGMTLVISPLLALMRDQTEQLSSRFNLPAACINTDQTDEENESARQAALLGKIRILFLSPEQLDHVDRFAFFSQLNISLLVIDEAHCISTWGHDFRPSYRVLLHFIHTLEEKNSKLKILGLTATADARVENDITKQLSNNQQMHVLRESMERPNICLSVLPLSGTANKLIHIETLLSSLDGSGLIYCATRDNTELVASYLQNKGHNSIAYHAGLESDQKRQIQDAFVKDVYKVVVATTALGMGIDKTNLRFILHFDFPGSITAYYQETGRCGRDGKKAQGILLYDPADKKIQEHFISSALPTSDDVETIFSIILNEKEPPTLALIKRAAGLHPTRTIVVLAELIEQNILKKQSRKGVQVYVPLTTTLSIDLSRYTNQQRVKNAELEKMVLYAEQTTGCRMATLRCALGDVDPAICGHCDLCLGETVPFSISAVALRDAKTWLQERPVPISATRTYRLTEGLSILDAKQHTPLFIHFMKERMQAENLEDELFALLKKHALRLKQEHCIAALTVLPSRTWKAREALALTLGKALDIPVFTDLLAWNTLPEKRQGELLNNDQRHHNVAGRMTLTNSSSLPDGPLLLLDDYIGSGASMKEAARALRQKFCHPLIPLTIASIKWHLGKPGFV
jgi:ATP-dependent DNA helicase RecQ